MVPVNFLSVGPMSIFASCLTADMAWMGAGMSLLPVAASDTPETRCEQEGRVTCNCSDDELSRPEECTENINV